MPIREGEVFCSHFLGESKEEADAMLISFDRDLTMLSNKVAGLTGLDSADLKQEGIIGLARARREFEKDRGAAFRTLALYKIKDAMREWVTKAGGMRIPQYLKDASRLVDSLQWTLKKGTQLPDFMSYTDVWKAAKAFAGDEAIRDDVNKACDSIKNLADRSHTTPMDLLERAELTPTVSSVPENADTWLDEPTYDEEYRMVERLNAKASVVEIRKLLTLAEYELLCAKYLEGKTERELEKEMGIKAPSIDVRLKNIIAKLQYNSERILNGKNKEFPKIEAERGAREAGANYEC